MIQIKIKKLHPDAVIPKYAYKGDAGLDLTAVEHETYKDEYGCRIHSYKTGIAVEIPEGYIGFIFPRSSIFKTILSLTNSVGVIDSNYRGEIFLKFRHDVNSTRPIKNSIYKIGDRIGQLIILPYPLIKIEEVNELSNSNRGEEGFGSSGT